MTQGLILATHEMKTCLSESKYDCTICQILYIAYAKSGPFGSVDRKIVRGQLSCWLTEKFGLLKNMESPSASDLFDATDRDILSLRN